MREKIRLEYENMILRSAISQIVHSRKGCFLSRTENWTDIKTDNPKLRKRCIKAAKNPNKALENDECIGCFLANIAEKAQKELSGKDVGEAVNEEKKEFTQMIQDIMLEFLNKHTFPAGEGPMRPPCTIPESAAKKVKIPQ